MNIYTEQLRSIALPNKYTNWYFNLVEKAQNRASRKIIANAFFQKDTQKNTIFFRKILNLVALKIKKILHISQLENTLLLIDYYIKCLLGQNLKIQHAWQ